MRGDHHHHQTLKEPVCQCSLFVLEVQPHAAWTGFQVYWIIPLWPFLLETPFILKYPGCRVKVSTVPRHYCYKVRDVCSKYCCFCVLLFLFTLMFANAGSASPFS